MATIIPVEEVNVANINRLIEALRTGELADRGIGFNMKEWFSEGRIDHTGKGCGTVACMGGTAQILQALDNGGDLEFTKLPVEEWYFGHLPLRMSASRWLGLNEHEGEHLFSPRVDKLWDTITVPEAIRALEILRDEKLIHWERAIQEVRRRVPHHQPA